MENLEVRYSTELRANTEDGTISGTAIVFDSESELLGDQFREVIKSSAATEDFLRSQDIVMKFNHQPDSILARYRPNAERNSLHFNVDHRGVHFRFKVKQKDAGILESVKDGDLSAASFAFRVSEDEDAQNWEKRSDGTYLRTITKFDAVKDFSIVIDPAYQATHVSARALDAIKEKEELERVQAEEKRLADERVAREKETALEEYYKKYDSILENLKK